ncbi:MAG: A-macroglobulin complement component [bacterium ADurb.Bin363]|nr:MAG: A-macroglobulin complement component [bacterium ADurb.Bin363]
MAFAVTTAGGNCKDWLMSLYNKRQELNSYSQAVLALSLKKAGYNKEALEIVKLLEKTADISGTTACWSGLTGSYGWTDNKVETTSYCLSALLAINPQSEIIPKVVRYLSFNRKGNYWYSTKDTAAAVMALTGYIKITKEMNPDFETDFYFNGTKLNTLKFTKDDVGKPGKKIEIPFDQGLLAGKNKVKFDIRGKGMLYYTIYLKYYTSEENVKAWDSGFKVKRTYYLLKENTKDPEKAKVKLENEAEVKSQDTILVELEVTGSANYEYLIIEDPKPAGCEYESLEVKQNYTLWNYWYAHKELRDEKCAYFATSYLPGTQKITYKMRAETPGTFHVMPTRAYLMYSPEVGGNSDELILKIRENKKEKTGLTPVPVTEKTIETPVAQTTPGTEEKKTPPSRTVLLVSITGVSVVIILTVLKAFKV